MLDDSVHEPVCALNRSWQLSGRAVAGFRVGIGQAAAAAVVEGNLDRGSWTFVRGEEWLGERRKAITDVARCTANWRKNVR